jgi:hypothetical protein
LAESTAESIPRFRDSRKKGGVMKGFLGSFLRRQENRLEQLAAGESVLPKQAGVSNGSVQIELALPAKETGLPPPEDGHRAIDNAEPPTAGKTGDTEVASGRGVWDATRAAALVAEVDRLIEKEVAPGGAANTEARRRVLRNDRSIIRRLQQARDPLLWEWPESIFRLLARWAAWDTGRTD